MHLSDDRVLEIGRLRAGITTPPWAWGSVGEKSNEAAVGIACGRDDQQRSGFVAEDEDVVYIEEIAELYTGSNNCANAAFIAAAPTIVDDLLAERRELLVEIGRLSGFEHETRRLAMRECDDPG